MTPIAELAAENAVGTLVRVAVALIARRAQGAVPPMRCGDLLAWLAWPRPIGYGRRVPASRVEQVTTEELLAVSGSTRDTLYEWAAKRLLPRPNVATGPGGEQFAVWPVESLERVRFIVGQLRQGLAVEAIVALVEERRPRR